MLIVSVVPTSSALVISLPSVELDELSHEREADAAALERATLRTVDAVEPLEHAADLARRDPHAGVAHAHHRGVTFLRERTTISPASVNLNAFDRRVEEIFSHISWSTQTGSASGWQSTTNRSPARATSDRNELARSVVSCARVGGHERGLGALRLAG